MTTTRTPRSTYRKASLYTAGLAGLWIALASVNPTTTYHLAPVLVAGAPPVMIAIDGEVQISAQLLASAAAAGLIGALAASFLTGVFGWADGPSLLPVGGPVLEGAAFAVGGAVIGFGLALQLHQRT